MAPGFYFRLGFLAGALLLAACAGNKDTYVEKPVEDLYNSAMDQLLDHVYDKAAKSFDEVERQHPYSVWATKAQLMSAYALYEAAKYDESIVAADRFIQLHPDHRAGKETEIGRWYEQQRLYLAAINRFKRVVDDHQTTTHVPEALHRLTECYMALGLTEEAQKTAAVLGYNYPGSAWYSDSYALFKTRQPTAVAESSGSEKPDPTPSKSASESWFGRVVDSVTSIF